MILFVDCGMCCVSVRRALRICMVTLPMLYCIVCVYCLVYIITFPFQSDPAYDQQDVDDAGIAFFSSPLCILEFGIYKNHPI